MRRISRVPKPLGMCAPCEAAQPSRRLAAQLPRQHPSRHTAAAISSASASARPLASRSTFSTAGIHARPFSLSATRLQTTGEAPTEDAVAVAAAEDVELAATVTPVVPVLAVPGPVETAPRPGNVGDATYVPAESGEGLEEVGGLDGWWEDGRHWDPALEFRGFGPAQRVTDSAALEVLARQAVLEALAVCSSSSSSDVSLTGAWHRGGSAARQAALSLDVDVAEDGSVQGLRGDVAGVVAGLSPADVELEDGATTTALDADEARELVGSWDASWKQVSLEDAALKFAITKRILQLTGHLLADAHLVSANTVSGLLNVLVRPPKPKKLAEELKADGTLTELPNVAVYGRRVTPIDKHKMVGRWKVIVQELEKRDLPVTGTGKYDKSVERKWVYR
ncbi:hypothetical protein CMQ_2283 [Grosmannia clavigera kw1407]|uniref:Large ribosomal subunit protein mL50 n=1 Tax=Grosmannia clavigera (strain kw1407 / UAMH 11150) TaxID=655863 RepID=F0XJE0_GROCL|nr:uncharacterized protein CMQ_2283 [Grosmannia clavigera kw1407]EFX02234.1 hypothetical protein CMQ_2283 [Grosmannia clavigera kw1407]